MPRLTASIPNIVSVTGVASTPGEIGGPAIRFVVAVKNATGAPVSLQSIVVTVYWGANKTPGIQLEKPGATQLPSTVAAGATAEGTFIYTVPATERSDVRIEVDYAAGVAPLYFEGSVPR